MLLLCRELLAGAAMIILENRSEMRRKIKNIVQRLDYNNDIFDSLDSDVEFEALDWFVGRLDSNSNFFKVESHAILTRALFLVRYYDLSISFALKRITFTTNDGSTYMVTWDTASTLSQILYDIIHVTEIYHSINKYNLFRQETRSVTDNLDENHQARKTWRKLLKLSLDYLV